MFSVNGFVAGVSPCSSLLPIMYFTAWRLRW